MKEITVKLLEVNKQTSSNTTSNNTIRFRFHHTIFIILMALKMAEGDLGFLIKKKIMFEQKYSTTKYDN